MGGIPVQTFGHCPINNTYIHILTTTTVVLLDSCLNQSFVFYVLPQKKRCGDGCHAKFLPGESVNCLCIPDGTEHD